MKEFISLTPYNNGNPENYATPASSSLLVKISSIDAIGVKDNVTCVYTASGVFYVQESVSAVTDLLKK